MSITSNELLEWIAVILFSVGLFALLAGMLVLLVRTRNKDLHTLAVQTTNLAKKGILDGVAGLVGNASSLMDATNQLVRTATGIGVFLIITGFILIGSSLLIIIKFL